MAHVERLTVYPVKALDGVDVETARIGETGTLAGDRRYKIVDADGDLVNGKRTDRVHDLRTDFDLDSDVLTVAAADEEKETRSFDLTHADDRGAAETWLGDFFGVDATLRRDERGGFPDRPSAGPSVISTATVETVADWFDLTAESVRKRMRANVEVGGVDPFWEDRFVGADAPAFEVDGVRFEGVEPCGRCVVPQRDPETGERDPSFRQRFVERRRETLPEWVDRDAFDHYYQLMLIADVPATDTGGWVAVGDAVSLVE